ncbi:MAG: hypothetical protein ACR2J9_03905 [Gaiellales bacterium]
MSENDSLIERVRAFAHMVLEGDHNVRNHLSATGATADVDAFLTTAKAVEDGQTMLILGSRHLPVAYQERRHRSRAGAWVTMRPGEEPTSGSTHMEEAEAVFAFATDGAADREVARLSEEHPSLAFRYAWFEHRGEREDVARGGLWKSGRRVAEHVGQVQEAAPDTEQLAALVRSVEALDVPQPAIAAPVG